MKLFFPILCGPATSLSVAKVVQPVSDRSYHSVEDNLLDHPISPPSPAPRTNSNHHSATTTGPNANSLSEGGGGGSVSGSGSGSYRGTAQQGAVKRVIKVKPSAATPAAATSHSSSSTTTTPAKQLEDELFLFTLDIAVLPTTLQDYERELLSHTSIGPLTYRLIRTHEIGDVMAVGGSGGSSRETPHQGSGGGSGSSSAIDLIKILRLLPLQSLSPPPPAAPAALPSLPPVTLSLIQLLASKIRDYQEYSPGAFPTSPYNNNCFTSIRHALIIVDIFLTACYQDVTSRLLHRLKQQQQQQQQQQQEVVVVVEEVIMSLLTGLNSLLEATWQLVGYTHGIGGNRGGAGGSNGGGGGGGDSNSSDAIILPLGQIVWKSMELSHLFLDSMESMLVHGMIEGKGHPIADLVTYLQLLGQGLLTMKSICGEETLPRYLSTFSYWQTCDRLLAILSATTSNTTSLTSQVCMGWVSMCPLWMNKVLQSYFTSLPTASEVLFELKRLDSLEVTDGVGNEGNGNGSGSGQQMTSLVLEALGHGRGDNDATRRSVAGGGAVVGGGGGYTVDSGISSQLVFSLYSRFLWVGMLHVLHLPSYSSSSSCSCSSIFPAAPQLVFPDREKWFGALYELITFVLRTESAYQTAMDHPKLLPLAPFLAQLMTKVALSLPNDTSLDWIYWGLAKSLNMFNESMRLGSMALLPSNTAVLEVAAGGGGVGGGGVNNHNASMNSMSTFSLRSKSSHDSQDFLPIPLATSPLPKPIASCSSSSSCCSLLALDTPFKALQEIEVTKPVYQIGDLVDGLFSLENGSKRWYPGRVTGINEDLTFAILFDDGDIIPKQRACDLRPTKRRLPPLAKSRQKQQEVVEQEEEGLTSPAKPLTLPPPSSCSSPSLTKTNKESEFGSCRLFTSSPTLNGEGGGGGGAGGGGESDNTILTTATTPPPAATNTTTGSGGESVFDRDLSLKNIPQVEADEDAEEDDVISEDSEDRIFEIPSIFDGYHRPLVKPPRQDVPRMQLASLPLFASLPQSSSTPSLSGALLRESGTLSPRQSVGADGLCYSPSTSLLFSSGQLVSATLKTSARQSMMLAAGGGGGGAGGGVFYSHRSTHRSNEDGSGSIDTPPPTTLPGSSHKVAYLIPPLATQTQLAQLPQGQSQSRFYLQMANVVSEGDREDHPLSTGNTRLQSWFGEESMTGAVAGGGGGGAGGGSGSSSSSAWAGRMSARTHTLHSSALPKPALPPSDALMLASHDVFLGGGRGAAAAAGGGGGVRSKQRSARTDITTSEEGSPMPCMEAFYLFQEEVYPALLQSHAFLAVMLMRRCLLDDDHLDEACCTRLDLPSLPATTTSSTTLPSSSFNNNMLPAGSRIHHQTNLAQSNNSGSNSNKRGSLNLLFHIRDYLSHCPDDMIRLSFAHLCSATLHSAGMLRLCKLLHPIFFTSCLKEHMGSYGRKIGEGGFGTVCEVVCPVHCARYKSFSHCYGCYKASKGLSTSPLRQQQSSLAFDQEGSTGGSSRRRRRASSSSRRRSGNGGSSSGGGRSCSEHRYHSLHQRRFAVKRLPRERSLHDYPSIIFSLFQEITALERLQHCIGVCGIEDYGVVDGEYWVVMEAGWMTLSQWRTHCVTTTTTTTSNTTSSTTTREDIHLYLMLYLDILFILREVHGSDVIHFDLKGSNFLLREDPRLPATTGHLQQCQAQDRLSGVLFLADFGEALPAASANSAGTSSSATSSVGGRGRRRARGTMAIQSPEMLAISESSSSSSSYTIGENGIGGGGSSEVGGGGGLEDLGRHRNGLRRSFQIGHSPSPSTTINTTTTTINTTIAGTPYTATTTPSTSTTQLPGNDLPGLASDIWSVGCLLVEILTGSLLFADRAWPELYTKLCLNKDPSLWQTDLLAVLDKVLVCLKQEEEEVVVVIREGIRKIILAAMKQDSHQRATLDELINLTKQVLREMEYTRGGSGGAGGGRERVDTFSDDGVEDDEHSLTHSFSEVQLKDLPQTTTTSSSLKKKQEQQKEEEERVVVVEKQVVRPDQQEAEEVVEEEDSSGSGRGREVMAISSDLFTVFQFAPFVWIGATHTVDTLLAPLLHLVASAAGAGGSPPRPPVMTCQSLLRCSDRGGGSSGVGRVNADSFRPCLAMDHFIQTGCGMHRLPADFLADLLYSHVPPAYHTSLPLPLSTPPGIIHVQITRNKATGERGSGSGGRGSGGSGKRRRNHCVYEMEINLVDDDVSSIRRDLREVYEEIVAFWQLPPPQSPLPRALPPPIILISIDDEKDDQRRKEDQEDEGLTSPPDVESAASLSPVGDVGGGGDVVMNAKYYDQLVFNTGLTLAGMISAAMESRLKKCSAGGGGGCYYTWSTSSGKRIRYKDLDVLRRVGRFQRVMPWMDDLLDLAFLQDLLFSSPSSTP